MNAQDWINKYKNFGERLRSSRILFFAATETMDLMQERIWKRGELTNGGKISYKENYEVYISNPPFPRKGDGKGKPYVDWIVRPESIDERRQAINKTVSRLTKSYQNTAKELARRSSLFGGSISGKVTQRLKERLARLEVAINVAERKKSAFANRFGGTARKIKTGWAPTYLAAKKQIDREDFPFELTGDLRKAWLGGPEPTPVEKGPFKVQIVVDDKTSKKIEGLTETKGEFLGLTKTEEDFHVAALVRLAQGLI